MVELMTDMWIYLVGAGVIGLIIGWAFRGAFIPAPKTVSVSASNSASGGAQLSDEQKKKIEDAEQSLATVSALEARVKSAQDVAADFQGKLRTAELELSELKAAGGSSESGLGAVTAGVVGAVAGAAGASLLTGAAEADPLDNDASDPVEPVIENDPKLVWRERYLSSRVRYLESQMVETKSDDAPVEEDTETDAVLVDNGELEMTTQKLAAAERRVSELEPLKIEVSQLKASNDVMQARLEQALETNKVLQEQAESAASNVASGVMGAVAGAGLAAATGAITSDDAPEPADEERVAVEETSNTAELEDIAKLKWQNRYLKARVLNLEAQDPPEQVEAAPVVDDETLALKSELDTAKAELAKFAGSDIDSEKELARLRWRNRYLEGRLKYLEASSLDRQSAVDVPTDSVAKALEEISKSAAQDMDADPEPVRVPTENEVRPPSLDAPDGEPADLKLIGGIGPKIAGILNELGIFHYHQIAAWSAEEEAWIDSYLRFQGRVMKEKWVEQAKALSSST